MLLVYLSNRDNTLLLRATSLKLNSPWATLQNTFLQLSLRLIEPLLNVISISKDLWKTLTSSELTLRLATGLTETSSRRRAAEHYQWMSETFNGSRKIKHSCLSVTEMEDLWELIWAVISSLRILLLTTWYHTTSLISLVYTSKLELNISCPWLTTTCFNLEKLLLSDLTRATPLSPNSSTWDSITRCIVLTLKSEKLETNTSQRAKCN